MPGKNLPKINLKYLSKNIQWQEIFVLSLSLLPIYVILVLIDRYAVNVPYWDEWKRSVFHYANGDLINLRVASFWKLTNQNRTFIPQIFNTFIGHLTSMNMLVLVYINLMMAVIIFLFVYATYRNKNRSPQAYLAAIPLALIIFSLAQGPRWVETRPLERYMASVGFVVAIYFVTTQPKGWRTLGIAAAMMYLSSLSHFTGNIAWFIVGGVLWLSGYRRTSYYIVWGLLTLSVIVPYAIEYFGRSFDSTSLNPFITIQYTFLYLGSPLTRYQLSSDQMSAMIVGFAGLAGVGILAPSIAFFVKDGFNKVLPWISLAAWEFIAGIAAAYGRVSQFGLISARTRRYFIHSNLFWVAVVALIAISLSQALTSQKGRFVSRQYLFLKVFPVGLSLLLGVGYISANLNVLTDDSFSQQYESLSLGQACLINYEIADDSCLKHLHPVPSQLRQVLPSLGEKNVSFLDPSNSHINMPLHYEGFELQRAMINSDQPREITYQVHTIDDGSYRVLYQPPPSAISWRFRLLEGRNATLSTGLLIDTPNGNETNTSKGVLYVINVIYHGKLEQVFQQQLILEENVEYVEIDLTNYEGETIDVVFETRFGKPDNATSSYNGVMWLAPHIIYE